MHEVSVVRMLASSEMLQLRSIDAFIKYLSHFLPRDQEPWTASRWHCGISAYDIEVNYVASRAVYCVIGSFKSFSFTFSPCVVQRSCV
jgi:hypothetical protein